MKSIVTMTLVLLTTQLFATNRPQQSSITVPGFDKPACTDALIRATLREHKLAQPEGQLNLVKKRGSFPFFAVTWKFSYTNGTSTFEGKAFPVIDYNKDDVTTTCYFIDSDCTGSLNLRVWETGSQTAPVIDLRAIEDFSQCTETISNS